MNQGIKDKIENLIGRQDLEERELLSHLKQIVYESELQNSVARESKSISDLVSENVNQLKSNSQNNNTIKSGFADFDKMFGGFGLGEFVVIGGRPAMGKTQLLVNLSLNISQTVPVLYFTFDLSELLLTSRFISSLSGIAVNKILQHELTEEQKKILSAKSKEIGKYKIFVNDSCNYSFSAMKAICQKHIQEDGVKVIIVDYIQMMSSNKYRNNRELEISYISRELKNIAKDFNVCVIATSQLSRAVESRGGSRHPQLSDLRDSGAIEQDADKVIFIYRPEYYGFESDEDGNNTEGLTEIILAKNRNGSLGSIKLLRDNNFTNFRSFDTYKNDFSFSQNRLDEITAKNPNLKNFTDNLESETPF
ncbi:MAG: DnaB-like helicase C-terminal domain-containing protein [Chitinophagales bacterium]|nr:DnaB-like helicase C-terminal domain-containing protein [Chitinophagales bacterium]MCZ2394101.1 DnaB-like helicase C-terminal domain-containing protein [Chitinophagales bacterium]